MGWDKAYLLLLCFSLISSIGLHVGGAGCSPSARHKQSLFSRIESWSSVSEIGISSKSKTTRKCNDFRGGEEGGRRGRVDWGQLGPS